MTAVGHCRKAIGKGGNFIAGRGAMVHGPLGLAPVDHGTGGMNFYPFMILHDALPGGKREYRCDALIRFAPKKSSLTDPEYFLPARNFILPLIVIQPN